MRNALNTIGVTMAVSICLILTTALTLALTTDNTDLLLGMMCFIFADNIYDQMWTLGYAFTSISLMSIPRSHKEYLPILMQLRYHAYAPIEHVTNHPVKEI